jgi:hypothetical protein
MSCASHAEQQKHELKQRLTFTAVDRSAAIASCMFNPLHTDTLIPLTLLYTHGVR